MSDNKIRINFQVDKSVYEEWMQIMLSQQKYFNKSDFYREAITLGAKEMSKIKLHK